MNQQENISYRLHDAKSAATVIVSLLFLSFTHQEGPAQGFLLFKGRCFLTTVGLNCLQLDEQVTILKGPKSRSVAFLVYLFIREPSELPAPTCSVYASHLRWPARKELLQYLEYQQHTNQGVGDGGGRT